MSLTSGSSNNSVGQQTSANSSPIVIASDQSAIPASQSGTWNINNISGTIALPSNAAQETGGNLATLASVTGSVGAGTAATKSMLAGGVFNTALPTLTNGQQSALQLDASGRLIIRPLTSSDVVSAAQSGTWTVQQGSAPWADNISQFGGSAVVTCTGAGGAGIPRVTVSNDSNILATQSGTWNINNISGTVSLPTGASTSALQTTINTSIQALQVAQGSTTSGQNGSLIQAAVTTNAPSYSTAQTSPLSMDTSGYLRMTLRSSGATGSAVPDRTIQVGGTDGTNLRTLTITATGVTPIQPVDMNPVSTTTNKYAVAINILQSANTASGTVFTMRNGAAATKDVIIDRIHLDLSYNGGANASTPRYSLVRFSAATPTGGTAITIAKLDNSSPTSQVTDVRFLDTGLTTTGVTFENGNLSSFSTSAANNNNDSVDLAFPIRLAAGEGLAIQILATTRTGVTINGHIIWSER